VKTTCGRRSSGQVSKPLSGSVSSKKSSHLAGDPAGAIE
jgi:hypothetical protein